MRLRGHVHPGSYSSRSQYNASIRQRPKIITPEMRKLVTSDDAIRRQTAVMTEFRPGQLIGFGLK